MLSQLSLLLTPLLVVGCGQKSTHNLDNDYGNANIKLGNPSKATTDLANSSTHIEAEASICVELLARVAI